MLPEVAGLVAVKVVPRIGGYSLAGEQPDVGRRTPSDGIDRPRLEDRRQIVQVGLGFGRVSVVGAARRQQQKTED